MTASHVVEKILSEGTQPSFFTLREMIHQQQTATASALVDAAVITVIVIWVIALLDVYRINKATIKSS